ncbi:fizzy-related-like [Solea senegalensis]|uniref:Fizzy-related protein homolog n=2 Tax=Solea senegalensis TaxID=28829 RepID=A0AAV6TCA3_SOLSE|nr:fizzy-related-like [Solea senegalensis]
MRFNEKELASLSRQPSEMAAELGMRGPKKGDVIKRRLVKLVVNFLFYFRTDEEEPVGALLLEQCRVEREDNQSFSITFLDEAERKYLFECDSEEQCGEWVDSIIKASYEFMRKNLIFYRTEIHRLTGKDPLEQYGISDETRFQNQVWFNRVDIACVKEHKPEPFHLEPTRRVYKVNGIMDQDYECRLLRQINIQNENASPIKSVGAMRALTPSSSPLSSPSKHGDRFIPSRAGANWSVNFHRINEIEKSHNQNRKTKDGTTDSNKADGLAYSALLKNELLGAGIEKVQDPQSEDRRLQPSTPAKRSLFSYSVSAKRALPEEDGNTVSPYSLSPVSSNSQKLLRSPRKPTRKISKIPFKVLDAPELQDDFYLNLVDWSSLNVLSVGLGTCVYLWSACTSQVTRLCDLSVEGDSVTSVGWSERGNLVAVGTHKGYVQIWDAAAGKKLSVLEGHTARVGALAWNADQLSSGSRDRVILQRDIRAPPLQSERRLQGHRQEVCGLKWSTDHQLLASGGNDNKLLVWNHSSVLPVQQYTEHLAAVKAIAWSPHQHGLLASGGGTADRCIRFWNTLTGQPLQCTDTGSQVCNLAWSKHTNELVSTHGYSQNQILVWKYPSLTQVAKLTGHSYRVLYLAMSPDGEAIVTGAGDETLRFWNVFSKMRSTKESVSVLNLFTRIR